MESKSEKLIFAGIAFAIITLFSLVFLGTAGLRTTIGFCIFVFAPFYFILDSFALKESEKIIYSIFLGLIIFTSMSYWIGFFISFKASIFVSFAILILIRLLIRKFKKKN